MPCSSTQWLSLDPNFLSTSTSSRSILSTSSTTISHATKISCVASLSHWTALPGYRAFVAWHIASVHRSCSRARAGVGAITSFLNWLAGWIWRQHLSQPDLAYSALIFSMELHSPRASSICFYIHFVEGCSSSTFCLAALSGQWSTAGTQTCQQ